MLEEKYILSGFTALKAIRKLRIEGCDFRPLYAVKVRLPSAEEIRAVRSLLNFTTLNTEIANHHAPQQKLNFVVGTEHSQKSNGDAVFSHYSGCWTRILVAPVNDKDLVNKANNELNISTYLGIVSPAFLLLQLSNFLSFEELLLLALEFCGTYVINKTFTERLADNLHCDSASINDGVAKMYTGFRPIMQEKDIDDLMHNLSESRLHGIKKLKRVAKFLKPHSASPMESRLYANLALPTTCGGFNLTNLKFNCSIQLSEIAASVAQQQNVIVDLCDIESKTAIEYDSRTFHCAIDQSQKDKRRRDGLEIDKFKCFSITTEQLNNFDTFFNYAKEIMLKIKGRSRIRTKNFDALAFAKYTTLRKASFKISSL